MVFETGGRPGDATAAYAGQRLLKTIYRFTEQKGCRTKLFDPSEFESDLLPAFPEIGKLIGALEHGVSHSGKARLGAHINLVR